MLWVRLIVKFIKEDRVVPSTYCKIKSDHYMLKIKGRGNIHSQVMNIFPSSGEVEIQIFCNLNILFLFFFLQGGREIRKGMR